MPEFLELLPPPEALKRLMDHLQPQPRLEEVDTIQALGRVTYDGVNAPHALPSFARSTVDGFSVRAEDTYGATEALPAYLRVAGEVPMGKVAGFALPKNQCALIHTGGMLPDGANAVVMVEYTQQVQVDEVEILRAVALGENVLKAGEDVAEGQEVIPGGIRLRPAEIGGLMALGLTRVRVSQQPRVGIISSGDEVVPPEQEIKPGQVRDVNAYTLSALTQDLGGVPVRYGIIPDRVKPMRIMAEKALQECDVVVITAGSSASTRDLTAEVINALGTPGVLVHGVEVRPGKPTILAVCNGKPVIGLPGNPVSALVIASIVVTKVLEALLGVRRFTPAPSVQARLTLNLPSQAGREDWIPVRLVSGPEGYQAEPVFGKSNLIFTLVRANGFIRIPADATGLHAGQQVEVLLS
ncbi:MAG: molybdopterin molybdenumtransferase MoeA [Anaerolineales bacterium]|nr:MAG: molybdopterin molybdenumtransferase MoeA [Anaerolineales bacterium]